MNDQKPVGLYLFKKETQERKVLKDLLQFLRTNSPGKGHSFSYIEAETSLHPHLSLWENIQLEVGTNTWKEFQQTAKPEWNALVSLLRNPHLPTHEAQIWECFLVSFIKGLAIPSQNLLIDMNEEFFSPLIIQNFKKSVIEASKEKTVYLATAHTAVWLDCAHTVVGRNEYKFELEHLNTDLIKRHWAA